MSLFDERYQIAFEGFPLFPFYVSFSLFSLSPPPPRSLFHRLTVSLLVLRWTFHPQPVCVLWTLQTVLLKGRVIKCPFMQAQSLWWGCHFVQCSALNFRNFRQPWPHPHRRTDRLQVDPMNDWKTVRLGPLHGLVFFSLCSSSDWSLQI